MTTTRRICTICNHRSIGTGSTYGVEDPEFCRQQGYCGPCGAEGQHEINHDNDQEWCNGVGDGTCWICNPELNKATVRDTMKTGHTNTVARTNTSHAGHDHPRTPAGRAACRKANGR